METKKGFQKHEASDSHMEAIARYVTVPATVIGDIGDLLSERHALEKSMNRKSLLSILSIIRCLARQALPLRGDWNTEITSEENSNFYQLLNLRAPENPERIEWLGKRVETSWHQQRFWMRCWRQWLMTWCGKYLQALRMRGKAKKWLNRVITIWNATFKIKHRSPNGFHHREALTKFNITHCMRLNDERYHIVNYYLADTS